MNEEQEKICKLLRAADIKVLDWWWEIKEQITNRYAKGYLDRLTTELGESLSSDTEDYRWELIEACEEFNLWDE